MKKVKNTILSLNSEYLKCVVITGSARELGLELAKEFKKNNYNVVISDILKEETKKVYNILGDYPDVISNFLVNKMIKNKKNNVRFNWLTNSKASFRFMTCAFNKRDFFK